jgi:hypothetical protein
MMFIADVGRPVGPGMLLLEYTTVVVLLKEKDFLVATAN